jgi:hypothetical protein
MKVSKTSLALFALALAAATSCDSSDGKGPGNPDAYQGKDGANGNECSEQFLNDWNDAAKTESYVDSDMELTDTTTNRDQLRRDAESLRDKATSLKLKYAGVSCVATDKSTGKTESIDVNSRTDAALKKANSILTRLSQPAQGSGSSSGSSRVTPPAASSPQCSSTFVQEYLDVANAGKTVGDDLEMLDTPENRVKTRADAVTLKDQAKAFQSRYAGYKCDVGTGATRYSIDVDAKMTELTKLANTVIDLIDTHQSTQPAAALVVKANRARLGTFEALSR